jgi:N-acetylglucosamine kinase-like BadF-type ATPase
MILIADSGSTKTDWRLVNENSEISSFSTIGFNPYFIDGSSVLRELEKSELSRFKKEITLIFFYGAGCSTEENRQIIKNSFSNFFINADINVNHDMLAAARSACGYKKGIVGILGTGSNSCLYDGNDIVENVTALGFVLGDYGSGANIGKRFIKAYLENELPKEISELFYATYKLTATDILEAVYKKALPNKFLASFSLFVSKHIDNVFIEQLVKEQFGLFFEKNICKYTNYQNQKIYLVGSIAFVYEQLIKDVANQYHLKIEKVIKQPIDGLVKFHLINQ